MERGDASVQELLSNLESREQCYYHKCWKRKRPVYYQAIPEYDTTNTEILVVDVSTLTDPQPATTDTFHFNGEFT